MGATTSDRAVAELGTVPARRYPFEDPGLAVDPPIISRRFDCVAEMEALTGFRLYVRFFDGTDGVVEMRDLIYSDHAEAFAALADESEFEKVGIGFGAVMWANELDLAPDAMYEEFKQHGKWVLS